MGFAIAALLTNTPKLRQTKDAHFIHIIQKKLLMIKDISHDMEERIILKPNALVLKVMDTHLD